MFARARSVARRLLTKAGYSPRRRSFPGQFQPYTYTLPDRYPWLFEFAAGQLASLPAPEILSFGCSRGDEVFALRRHVPNAFVTGLDVDPRNIAKCVARARSAAATNVRFHAAANTEAEPAARYDAIFCLAVLCHGDLTTSGAERCDPLLTFARFEKIVADFARCLKPGGLLFLHTTNFRFCDTASAQEFDAVFAATDAQLATDVLFDREGRLMPGLRYYDVGFRKRT